MGKRLFIIGAGGHGRVVADAASLSTQWNEIIFIDDKYPKLNKVGPWPVIGTMSDLHDLFKENDNLVVAIGDNTKRLHIQQWAKDLGYFIAIVIHPSAQVSKYTEIGEGTVVFANCVVNMGSLIGCSVIINSATSVDHDNRIGDGVHLSPGVHLGGDVSIGSNSWLGIGASVVHGCQIGANVVVGAGSVVISDVAKTTTVAGVPAKIMLS